MKNQEEFLKNLIGKEIMITPTGEVGYLGTLLWYDTYCICIECDMATRGIREVILYKNNIVSLCEY